MSYSANTFPNLSQCVGGQENHRDKAGPAPRGGNVTVGSPYTMPNGTKGEIAREIYIGAGSGSIVLRQSPIVENDVTVSGDVTFVVSAGQKIHMLSIMVVSCDDSMVDALVWLS